MLWFMRVTLLAVLLCTLAPMGRAQANDAPRAPVSFGAFEELGPEWGDQPNGAGGIGTEHAGIFAEFTRHAFRPGLELQGVGGTSNVSGLLAGPRLSYTAGRCTLFGVGLFGAAHLEHYQTSTGSNVVLHGLYSGVAVGFDLMSVRVPQVGFRQEISLGTFSGLAGSVPFSWSAGVVLRLPR
jgi:hypothetical protein